jgi:hypothetical protein
MAAVVFSTDSPRPSRAWTALLFQSMTKLPAMYNISQHFFAGAVLQVKTAVVPLHS